MHQILKDYKPVTSVPYGNCGNSQIFNNASFSNIMKPSQGEGWYMYSGEYRPLYTFGQSLFGIGKLNACIYIGLSESNLVLYIGYI